MKPAWDSLMKDYEDHPSVLIGDVRAPARASLVRGDGAASGAAARPGGRDAAASSARGGDALARDAAAAARTRGGSSAPAPQVDCTQHKDLCSDVGVGGYPTIKYWTDGAGKDDGQPYQGGRDLAALQKHVSENLLPKCDAKDPEGSGCDDQEIAYVAKMAAKGDEAVAKELKRLEGMQGGAMKPDKKAWLAKRVHILKGLSA